MSRVARVGGAVANQEQPRNGQDGGEWAGWRGMGIKTAHPHHQRVEDWPDSMLLVLVIGPRSAPDLPETRPDRPSSP